MNNDFARLPSFDELCNRDAWCGRDKGASNCLLFEKCSTFVEPETMSAIILGSRYHAMLFGQYLLKTALGHDSDIPRLTLYSFVCSPNEYIRIFLAGMMNVSMFKLSRNMLFQREKEAARRAYLSAVEKLRDSNVNIVDARGFKFQDVIEDAEKRHDFGGMIVIDSMMDLSSTSEGSNALWWSSVATELRRLAVNRNVAVIVLASERTNGNGEEGIPSGCGSFTEYLDDIYRVSVEGMSVIDDGKVRKVVVQGIRHGTTHLMKFDTSTHRFYDDPSPVQPPPSPGDFEDDLPF